MMKTAFFFAHSACLSLEMFSSPYHLYGGSWPKFGCVISCVPVCSFPIPLAILTPQPTYYPHSQPTLYSDEQVASSKMGTKIGGEVMFKSEPIGLSEDSDLTIVAVDVKNMS